MKMSMTSKHLLESGEQSDGQSKEFDSSSESGNNFLDNLYKFRSKELNSIALS